MCKHTQTDNQMVSAEHALTTHSERTSHNVMLGRAVRPHPSLPTAGPVLQTASGDNSANRSLSLMFAVCVKPFAFACVRVNSRVVAYARCPACIRLHHAHPSRMNEITYAPQGTHGRVCCDTNRGGRRHVTRPLTRSIEHRVPELI